MLSELLAPALCTTWVDLNIQRDRISDLGTQVLDSNVVAHHGHWENSLGSWKALKWLVLRLSCSVLSFLFKEILKSECIPLINFRAFLIFSFVLIFQRFKKIGF